jgi:hypothetical protein
MMSINRKYAVPVFLSRFSRFSSLLTLGAPKRATHPPVAPPFPTTSRAPPEREWSPAILGESSNPVHGRGGRIVQITQTEARRGPARNNVHRSGMSVGMHRDMNRRAGLALRRPANDRSDGIDIASLSCVCQYTPR